MWLIVVLFYCCGAVAVLMVGIVFLDLQWASCYRLWIGVWSWNGGISSIVEDMGCGLLFCGIACLGYQR